MKSLKNVKPKADEENLQEAATKSEYTTTTTRQRERGVGKELTNYPIISFKLHCFTAAGIAVAAGCGVGGDSDSDDVKWLKKCEQNEKAHKTEYNENNNNNNNNKAAALQQQ